MPRLIAAVAAGLLALSVTAQALGSRAAPARTASVVTRIGSIEEAVLGSSNTIYLFGMASGPDGNVWFADLGCAGLGRCAVGRITPKAGSRPSHAGWIRAASRSRSPPDRTATCGSPTRERPRRSAGSRRGADHRVLAPDCRREPAVRDRGRARRRPVVHRPRLHSGTRRSAGSPQAARSPSPRGLPAAACRSGSPPGRDGSIWFTDHGCSGADRARSGVTGGAGSPRPPTACRRGSPPLGIAAGPDGNMWFTDEGATSAIGRVTPPDARQGVQGGP